MLSVFLKAFACVSVLVSSYIDDNSPRIDPTVDISAIRYIDCTAWVGSGFLIGPKIMATALHVVAKDAKCVDKKTGTALRVYKTDEANDLALVTGDALPTDIPYIKISCAPFKTGEKYLSFGQSPFGMDDWENAIQRMNVIEATGKYEDITLEDGTVDNHMRIFKKPIAPGMSGGPVADMEGYAHALNNAGSDTITALHEFRDGMLCPH